MKRCLRRFKEIDSVLWEQARAVVDTFPLIANPDSTKNAHADPFIIGLALILTDPSQARIMRRDVFVVSDERSDLIKNPKLPSSQIKRIPDVCRYYKLKWINHLEMFKMEKFRFY
jgi:hypothetical protein